MPEDHDLGLSHDLERLVSRRRALKLLASASTIGLAGCDQYPFSSRAKAEVTARGADGTECVAHPEETAGPFPADGSNRAHGRLANVLRDSGIVRTDMRGNLNASLPAAEGSALKLTIHVVDAGRSCAPLSGHAIYLWHCDAVGKYSIYDKPGTSYLRAVGVADAQGKVEFMTIVPGCYRGRFPHMHFEVYPSLQSATDYKTCLLTSQLVIPAQVCEEVYRDVAAYGPSLANLARVPLRRDMVFRDNTLKELAAQTLAMKKDRDSYSGSVTIGLEADAP